ncbi:hypothetical protein QAD02_014250 [Eretmocerus hayati]|uniref:Uncharacterized protein n=1 Tax=Eretmocerus hayati TaxID=131215 RepID=A0ACC2P5R7_9HYME|nr:hypothetical protein QAD02_014250 [Eretmocerus hayati]
MRRRQRACVRLKNSRPGWLVTFSAWVRDYRLVKMYVVPDRQNAIVRYLQAECATAEIESRTHAENVTSHPGLLFFRRTQARCRRLMAVQAVEKWGHTPAGTSLGVDYTLGDHVNLETELGDASGPRPRPRFLGSESWQKPTACVQLQLTSCAVQADDVVLRQANDLSTDALCTRLLLAHLAHAASRDIHMQ